MKAIISFALGAIFGVVMMCLMQIAKKSDKRE